MCQLQPAWEAQVFFRVKGETEDAQTQALPRSVKVTKNLAGSCHAGYIILFNDLTCCTQFFVNLLNCIRSHKV